MIIRCLLALCWVACGSVGLAATASDSTPESVYTAPITGVELASWLELRGASRMEDPRREALQLALTRVLADLAVVNGVQRRPYVRIRLAREEAKVFRQLVRKQSFDLVEVSDEVVEAGLHQVSDRSNRPRRLRLRNIFKRYSPDADDMEKRAVRRQMEELREQLMNGADFVKLAEAESDSQTRLRGGLIGNVKAGTLRPEIDAVAMAMKKGEISEILDGPEGLTLLLCEDELEAVERTEDEIRQAAHTILENQAYKKDWAELEARLLQQAAPRIDWRVLESGSASDADVLVSYSGGWLTVAEVRVLVYGNASRESVATMPRERLLKQIDAFVTRAQMKQEAAARGLYDDAVEQRRIWTRRQVLASAMLAELIEQRMRPPTEIEQRAYFDAVRDELKRPRQLRLSCIVIPLDEDDPRPGYRLGERLVHDLERGAVSFAEAARLHSGHPSAEAGGDLGWLSQRTLSRRLGIEISRALSRLDQGERTDLVEEAGALWILAVDEVEPVRPMTFEEARQAIENRIGNARVKEVEAEILAEWTTRLDVRLLISQGAAQE